VSQGGPFALASLAAGDYCVVVHDGPTVLLTRKLSPPTGVFQ